MTPRELRDTLRAEAERGGLPKPRHIPIHEELRRARHLADFMEQHAAGLVGTPLPSHTPARLRTLADLVDEASRAVVPHPKSQRLPLKRALLDQLRRLERVLDFLAFSDPREGHAMKLYRRALRRRGRGIEDLNRRTHDLLAIASRVAEVHPDIPGLEAEALAGLLELARKLRWSVVDHRFTDTGIEARDRLRSLLRFEMERAQMAARAMLSEALVEAICYDRRPPRPKAKASPAAPAAGAHPGVARWG